MDKDRYAALFESEAGDILQSMEEAIVALEKEPKGEIVAELFRLAHTLKGMAGMMGFDEIAAVAHALEDMLSSLREGKTEASSVIDLMLEVKDGLSTMVGSAIAGREEDPRELIAKIEAGGRGTEVEEEVKAEKKEMEKGEIKIEKIESVKIGAERLDRWTSILGELIILRAGLEEIARTHGIEALEETVSSLGKLLGDMRDDLLESRLVPASLVFNRFPRMVRDLAKDGGKEVEFTIVGGEIELDRLILDRISEPLVHLVRNAVAHGIEKPEERIKKGKDKVGNVNLKAERAENRVIIKVEDDGKGVDLDKVKRAAIEKGLLGGEEELDEKRLLDLLFTPGFTTVAKPTETSGRGVGLEAVAMLARAMKGTFDLKTRKGEGTAVTLSLPLTTAIIQALMIRIGGQTYALPLDDVLETVQINANEIRTLGGKEAILLRGEVVPLIRLATIFGLEGGNGGVPAVIVRKEGRPQGLIVDELFTKQEILVKPLDPVLGGVRGISGSTILGDGSVALILDVAAL